MEKGVLLAANILIVVDADAIMSNCNKPSVNFNKPIAIDTKNVFMARSVKRIKPVTKIDAIPQENLIFRGISSVANSDAAIILYSATVKNSKKTKFRINKETINNAVVPDVTTANGLPAVHASLNFLSLSSVMPAGVHHINVSFGIYTIAADGETQRLYGYFCFTTAVGE